MKELINQLQSRYNLHEIIRNDENQILLKMSDLVLNKVVALKFVKQDCHFHNYLFREFLILKQFHHPNLMPVLDFQYLNGLGSYFTMPFLDTIDVIRMFKKEGNRGLLFYLFQLLCGLHYLHQRNIIHGDLSISNILCYRDSKNIRIRISDFGFSSLLKEKQLSGTVHYLAPELIQGKQKKYTIQTDLYALGVILYEIVTGKPPFQGDNFKKIMENHVSKKVSPISIDHQCDNKIKNCIYTLLEKNPKQRYENCSMLFQEMLPLFKKYKVIQDDELYWKNVLQEIWLNKKISVTFFRKKQITNIVKSINYSKNISIIGKKDNFLSESIQFLSLKLSQQGNVVLFPEKDSNSVENLIIMHESLIQNTLGKIFLFFTEEMYKRSKENLQRLKEKYSNLRLIVFGHQGIVKKETDFQHKKFMEVTNIEVEEYLNLLFGASVLPKLLHDHLIKNSGKNIRILHVFVTDYIKKRLITSKHLKWFFGEEEIFKTNLPTHLEKEFIEKINLLTEIQQNILYIACFWKEHFTKKEISEILQLKMLTVDEEINHLKDTDLVVQPAQKFNLKYAFLSELIKNKKSQNSTLLQKIIAYCEKISVKSNEEWHITISCMIRLNLFGKALEEVEKLYENQKNDATLFASVTKMLFPYLEYFKNTFFERIAIIIHHYVWALERTSQYEQAQSVFNELVEMIKDSSNEKLINDVFVRNLYFLNKNKQYVSVLDIYQDQKARISEFLPLQKVKCLNHISFAMKVTGKFEFQINLLKEVLNICEGELIDDFLQAKFGALEDLASAYLCTGRIEKSIPIFKNASDVAVSIKNFAGSAYIHCRLAWIYMQTGKKKSVLPELQKAEKLLEKTDVQYPRLALENVYGNYFMDIGDYFSALQHYHIAQCLFKKQNEDFSIPMGNKCIALLPLGYFSQTIHYARQTIEIKQKNQQLQATPIWKSCLFAGYLGLEKYRMAAKIYKENKQREDKKEIPFNFIMHYYQGKSLLSQSKFGELKNLIAILKENSENESENIFLTAYLELAYYNACKKDELATEKCKEIEKILSKFSFNGEELQDYYFLTYKIKKRQFESQKCFDDYRKYLKKSFDVILKKIQYLPTEKMKKHYKNLPLQQKIIKTYEQEFSVESSLSQNQSNLMESLQKITFAISQNKNREKLFQKMLEIILSAVGAERGLIITISNDNSSKVKYSSGIDRANIDDVVKVNKKIIESVITSKEAFFHTDVTTSSLFETYRSFFNLKIRSVVCLPLILHKKILGSVYLDSQQLLVFTPDKIKFFHIIAQIAASAIETSNMYFQLENQKENLKRMRNNSIFYSSAIIGKSESIQEVIKKIRQIAKTEVPVLIQGESGTGKELVAQEIYNFSSRSSKTFLPIDCGSLSEQIIESELFGHKKGAFSGAYADKIGIFEEANNGTIFLDEISNISLTMQVKLLRLIQEGEFKRVGENLVRNCNVRLIVASNKPLAELVKKGLFREDLYYRLSIFPITIPPLRERMSDILYLIQHFIQKYNLRYQRNILGIKSTAVGALKKYHWPGNIRQLQNEIERACIISENDYLDEKLFTHLQYNEMLEEKVGKTSLNALVNEYKKNIIEKTLQRTGHNWTQAAELLGVSRQNLRQIYQRLNREG